MEEVFSTSEIKEMHSSFIEKRLPENVLTCCASTLFYDTCFFTFP